MQIIPLSIPDLILIQPKVFGDARGFFMESYQLKNYVEIGLTKPFVQDNHSRSSQGVLRGLHFQVLQPQGKLVRVVLGEIFDVAVDLRQSSPTFAQWSAVRLSAENKQQLWVPPGFAHGFYVVSDWAEVLYKVTEYWQPEFERTLLWNDPALGIEWPLANASLPILSPKDQRGFPLQLALDGEIDAIYRRAL